MANYTGATVLSILQNNNIADGSHQFTAGEVNINSTNIKVKNFYGNQTISAAGTEFSDIDQDHTYTCVRIFHGNLTISGSYDMRPPRPVKGFFVFVKGKLTIENGSSISMTGEGATGSGVDVYLANVLGTDVFVPASGTTSAAAQTASATSSTTVPATGATPSAASDRRTGGGGSGGATATGTGITSTSGAGSLGTSWSGGSGGGGSAVQGTSGSATAGTQGGAGGSARTATTAATSRYAGGGAGNNGGAGREIISAISANGTAQSSLNGQSGTGGLLVVYARFIENATGNTAFSSKGLSGGGTASAISAGGGGSGGGSVNIFYMFDKTNLTDSQIDVTGGSGGASSTTATGGAGGDGSKKISSISAQRLSLFVSDNKYYRYRPTSSSAYQWEEVGSATGTTTEKQTILQTYGMTDLDLTSYIDGTAISGLPNVVTSAVTLQTYVPS